MTIYIYHELQESQLCGQHCLNNLLQDDFFNAVHLSEIAQELDDNERAILTGGEQSPTMMGRSANVDESGNFSIQVLRLALQRYNNVDLVPWHYKSEGSDSDPLEQQGFVVNRSDHWFTIRKINNNWWNLNSTSERPELISPFYLSAFLHQLRGDGYSVFIAKGTLPTNTEDRSAHNRISRADECGRWYSEDELMGRGRAAPAGGGGTTAAKPSPFSGAGNRLGSSAEDTAAAGAVNLQDFCVDGEEMDEDLLLAQAISASLATSNSSVSVLSGSTMSCASSNTAGSPIALPPTTGDAKKDAAAELRARRLAALEKRGL